MAVIHSICYLAVCLSVASASLDTTGGDAYKIDTHSYIYPDFYRDAVTAAGWIPGPDGIPAPPGWSVESHLAFMEQNNMSKSILSCSSPGTFLVPNDTAGAVNLARRINDYLANLTQTYPDKFGFFASLPLPSISDSLKEIDRVLQDLNPDGFIFSSNAFGLYGGDPKLTPVYQKLNQSKSAIFVHPASPCPINTPDISGTPRLNYEAPLMDTYAAPTLEYIFDSTRNLGDLIMTGTAARHSEVKWIIAHCGAALPSILTRIVTITSAFRFQESSDRTLVPYDRDNATALLRRQFWFDLAGWPTDDQIYGMRRLFSPEKFLYGSSVPFTSFAFATMLAEVLAQDLPDLFNEIEVEMIMHGNAEGLHL